MKIEKELGLEGTEEEAEAIAKLQAVQRGKIARKEVEELKAERDAATDDGVETDSSPAAAPPKLEPTPPAMAAPEGSRGRAPLAAKPAAAKNDDSDDDYG